ncbi:hypothetical protein CDD83_8524 [Cordyceps sp. RAO-2017]|nr:hypothetical protein CDD83_8524 [Cordyceps sp. RAO-2017]
MSPLSSYTLEAPDLSSSRAQTDAGDDSTETATPPRLGTPEQSTLDSLLRAVQATNERVDKVKCSHSIQIVGLQGQLSEARGDATNLRNEMALDRLAMEAVQKDIGAIHGSIVYLKGCIARLAVESFSSAAMPVTAQPAAARTVVPERAPAPEGPRMPVPDSAADATLMDRLLATGGNLDLLADRLLQGQKQQLLEKLKKHPIGAALTLDVVIRQPAATNGCS